MFESTREEYNAAFLKAVRKGDLDKAMKWLTRGSWDSDRASINAVDSEGNTALHLVAEYHRCSRSSSYSDTNVYLFDNEGKIEKFVSYLISRGLDINSRNNQGQTCLHRVAVTTNSVSAKQVVGILRMQGASLEVKDKLGRTPLHAAAYHGADTLVNSGLFDSLMAVKDNEGNYPYQLAQMGGNTALAQQLKEALDKALKSGQEQPAAAADTASTSEKEEGPVVAEILPALPALPSSPPEEPLPLANEWVFSKDEVSEISRVRIRPALNCSLIEIFNFSARTLTKITRNLETKTDSSPDEKSFDAYADKTPIESAYDELIKRGGVADKKSIYERPAPAQPLAPLPRL